MSSVFSLSTTSTKTTAKIRNTGVFLLDRGGGSSLEEEEEKKDHTIDNTMSTATTITTVTNHSHSHVDGIADVVKKKKNVVVTRASDGSNTLESTTAREEEDDGYNIEEDEYSQAMSTRYFVRSDEFVRPSMSISGHNDSSSEFLTMSDADSLSTSKRNSSKVHFPEKRRSSQASETLESLTINKLRFDSLDLYGRKNEIHTLKVCLERIQRRNKSSSRSSRSGSGSVTSGGSTTSCGEDGKDDDGENTTIIQSNNNNNNTNQIEFRELVMIKGYSGTGKSALASTLRKPVENLGGLYVNGKFDLFMRDEPLVGVLSACNQICGAILALQWSNQSKFEEIRDEITLKLGSELGVILRHIPVLEEVLSLDDVNAAKETDKTKGQSNEESKNQFNFAFRRFIRVIGAAFKPLVMVLDDLQWSDVATLELLDVLITDRENPNLMIVGLYRSNEVDDTHLLAKTLRDLQTKKDKDKFNITDIEVGNLGIDSINRMIQDLLSCSDDRTLALADICLKKTRGNVFFLIRYLCAIKEQMLLQYNIGLLKWTWDVHEIELHTKATDNVVDLLKSQMQKLPSETSQMLQLCAFLGSTFNKKIAHLVWKEAFNTTNEGGTVLTDEILEIGLKSAEKQGFIEQLDADASKYRWIHDKIQEAAMSLVPKDDRNAFGGRVGRALVARLNVQELEEAIFTAVNLLNEDPPINNEEECIKLATFNLRAAKKASHLSSFASAAKYARKGIEMLPTSPWKSQYQMTLELYTVAAEAEVSQGDAEEAEILSREVINQQEGPVHDKFRAYSVLMDSVANRDRMLEGLEIGLDLLSQCGCHFPKSSAGITFQTLWGITKAKSNVKTFCNPETLRSLPVITDPFRIGMMQILFKILPYAYMSRTEYLPLAVMRNLFWTMKYGLCEYSASAFAWMGTIFSSLGDIQTAKIYAEHASRIMETHESGITQSLVLCVTYCFTLHWLNPLQQMLKPLLKSYEVGMQMGDTESAGWGIYHHTFLALQAGHQLESLAHDASVYSRQMWELGRIKQSTYFNVTWQLCLNLMGHSEDPLVLTGEAMDEEDYAQRASGKSIHLLPFLLCHRIILYGYFGAYQQGAELALQVGDLTKEIPGAALVVMCACMDGLSLCHMARQTGKRKYKKGAKKFIKKIKSWLAHGNPNLQHWDCLLNAEWAALQGKQHIAKRNYETAIIVAARSGFVQDAALSSERYGEFLVNELKEKEDGMYRLQQAIRFFGEWGAKGKVEQIEKRYAGLWPKPDVIVTRPAHLTPP